MAWRMSKETTEKSGEWLYRAIMGVFIVSMWHKVDSIAVLDSRVTALEKRADKIEGALFAPAFDRKKQMESHVRETDSLTKVIVENINDSHYQINLVDSLLTASK
jgi:hypothetical protein